MPETPLPIYRLYNNAVASLRDNDSKLIGVAMLRDDGDQVGVYLFDAMGFEEGAVARLVVLSILASMLGQDEADALIKDVDLRAAEVSRRESTARQFIH